MNKQELIDKLKNLLTKTSNEFDAGHDYGIRRAIVLTKQLEEQQTFISSTPPHYQGTIQPIDLINAQDLNFNLGNVVKYVCRAGKKQGENILSDLEKAKDYINFEIERVKKWKVFIYWFLFI